MRILKNNVILRLYNSYLVDSPQPANISYVWNFGSLLATCLILQILTGCFLAMHYVANIDLAFNSVEHIMRDVENGYLIRYIHANVASFFFIFVYAHVGRNLYYGSFKSPRILVWSIGVIILILMMAVAFLGYVLPYGQMSLWGATVITNLLSAIPVFGQDIVELIWGGFSVSNATLNRFFSLHYILPFVLAALAAGHMIALHVHGLDLFGPNILYIQSLSLKTSLAFILPNYKPRTRIGPHNEEIISVLVGALLGDGYAERLPSGGVRFRFRQSVKHKEYIFWLCDFFNKRGYCTNNTPVKFKQKLIDTYHEGYRFNTYAYTSWIDIYKLFYNSRKKKVIPNNIENLLTPLTLAIWIMDDGTFKYSGVRIATNCFKKQEVELLVRALDSKFNIKSTLHKNNNNYQLYIKKESMFLLKKLVVPHMIPSMFYKLGL